MSKNFLFVLLISHNSCVSLERVPESKYTIPNKDTVARSNESWVTLNNNQSIDGYTKIGNSIFGGEIACNVKPLSGVDVLSFKVLPGTKYAKDTNLVYFPLAINCIDYDECGVCYFSEVIVQLANPTTFRLLGNEYSTDGNYAYFRGRLINDADAETFRIIQGPESFYFAVDKNKVYKYGEIFKDADPSTFRFDKNNLRNDFSIENRKYIISDKNSTWEYSPPDHILKLSRN